MNQLATQAAKRLKSKLEATIPGRLMELRIFGSRARHQAGQDSDLDLLIMVDSEDPELREVVVRAACEVEAEMAYAFPISPCIMSVERYQDLLDRELLFALEVERDGVAI